jgi:molybdopterin/thiamine biosynthesis adenylyltransferase
LVHVFQVGAGSGGMPVLDMLARDRRIGRVTLVEPDVYKPHNVERHLFPASEVGEFKAVLAEAWLKQRRPDLEINLIVGDLLDVACQAEIETAAASADIGICAADNEPAKYHFDSLMRKFQKPWTLGEVLSGGIGGFVHGFVPGGPCYGCVATHLKRSVEVEKPAAPDYSQPSGAVVETTVPAGIAAIHVIASLHALITLELLFHKPTGRSDQPATDDEKRIATDVLPFTSLLLTLKQVPDLFGEAFRPFRFRIARSPDCLVCRAPEREVASEDLDVALHQAFARLGHE